MLSRLAWLAVAQVRGSGSSAAATAPACPSLLPACAPSQAVGLTGRLSSLFAMSEFSVSFVVLGATGAFSLVSDNRRALGVILCVSASSGLCLGLLTVAHQRGLLPGFYWIILVGAADFLA